MAILATRMCRSRYRILEKGHSYYRGTISENKPCVIESDLVLQETIPPIRPDFPIPKNDQGWPYNRRTTVLHPYLWPYKRGSTALYHSLEPYKRELTVLCPSLWPYCIVSSCLGF